MSSDEQKLRYLAAAHHKIRGLTVDEENAVREYEDLANMLELAGSKTICATIRKIAESEKRHALDLKTSATMLNQAIKQLERIRELKKMEKTSVPLRNIKDNPHIPVRAFKIEGDGGYTPRE
ncbi:MAG: hypothetical protein OEY81_07040, partial [Candidatus Bathyarchaeota archaeon]|nr:hypothetical protein [Candidatus Bathyarchaeota archaeon]